MKPCASIAQIIKNDSMRKGGLSFSQWVLVKALRRPSSLAEEHELGQLGVLASQQNATTEFGFKAKLRMSMQKAVVRMDCGRWYAIDMLREANDNELVTSQWTRFVRTHDHQEKSGRVQPARQVLAVTQFGYNTELTP